MSAKAYTVAALMLFIILGAVDFISTYALVEGGNGAYESNPLASAWLKNYGWKGLAIFKAASTMMVFVTVLVISRHRPRTAAVLATFASVVVLSVAIYSRYLMTLPPVDVNGLEEPEVSLKIFPEN